MKGTIIRPNLIGFAYFGLVVLGLKQSYVSLLLVIDPEPIILVPSTTSATERYGEPHAILQGAATLEHQQQQQRLQLELTPLQGIDYEQYTIRINTWRRPEQLIASVLHHASCPGVNQVQVVWCDPENEPPQEILDPIANTFASKVVIERHEENSLNERFHILLPTTTLGILSIDDDVIRPCQALDSGFFKWVKSPHRMVGFDARDHIIENPGGDWKYGYLSTTQKMNMYSMSLTRSCFIHRDYLDHYMNELPKSILETVAKNFNCEDIAMSFMISSLTQGQPPLLADMWAINTLMKLDVEKAISGSKGHKKLRDGCVDSFATILGLKDETGPNRLQMSQFVHRKQSFFYCGAKEDDRKNDTYPKSQREVEHEEMLKQWKSMGKNELKNQLGWMMSKAGARAYESGLLGSMEKK
jgi:glucuronyl/N-acetylglucosaminyl transferase EXT2